MSSKGIADSEKLEDDLTREVEQDEEAGDHEEEDEIVEKATQDQETTSKIPQLESTNKRKARRTRPKATDLKTKLKRRKTSDSEQSDLSEHTNTASVANDEPVAGPSSDITKESHGQEKTEKILDNVDDEDEEDMEADESSIDEVSHPVGAVEYTPESRNMHDDQVLEEEAPTSSSYRVMEGLQQHDDLEDKPSTSLRYQRSAVLEEIFRMPLYDSDSRRSIFDVDDDDGHNEQVDEEVPGPSRLVQTEGPAEEQRDAANLLQEKQRMMWARKIFLRSTELIFPGYARYTDDQSQRREYMAVRVRSSWALQALLYADLLFFIMWFLAFLSTFDIAITVLKELHGNLVLCMTALFTLVNIPRLLFGLKGNEKDKLEFLALFWMMTFIVQAPLFGFILFTDVFTPIRLAFTLTMDSIMFIFILLEVIVGTIHLKDLIRDELKIIELAKKSENLMKGQQVDGNLRPRVVNTAGGPTIDWVAQNNEPGGRQGPSAAEDSEDDWSTDESVEEFSRSALGRDPAVDYQLKIRRLRSNDLEEEPERDDSNQVSSTSDSIRQRQVRVI